MAPTIPRPEPLPVNLDGITNALTIKNQWVMWCYVWIEGKDGRPGKWDKPPLKPNGENASSTAKFSWSTFREVEAAYKKGLNLPVEDPLHFDGIGFVVRVVKNSDLQLVFGDLDKCRNKETGEISPDALEDLKSLNTYCEPSPSGTGLRFVAYGAPPFPPKQNGRKKGHIELYQGDRYLTITGQRLAEFPATIEKRPEELNAFYEKHFGKPRPKKQEEESTHARAQDRPNCPKLTDDQIIALAAQAHNSPKFLSLMDGKYEHFLKENGEKLYPTQSEADLALCQITAFYTTNTAQIDRIFRRSKLYREKWDRDDYQARTVRTALERTTEHYSGGVAKDIEPEDKSDEAADKAEAKAREEPLRLEDVCYTKYNKDGKECGLITSATKAAGAVVKKMRVVMSEESNDIYIFDGYIYKPDGARKIDLLLCHLLGDEFENKNLSEVLRRIRNTLLNNPVRFEPDPYLLPVANKVCDLRTGKVREYRPEDLLLERLEVIYDPDATCPVFLNFLESITPVIIDRLTLIDWFGATAIKEAIAYVLFLLGLGRNGKGIYEKLIKKFFGMASFRDMPLQAIEKSDFAAGAFYRKRGWIASETGKKGKKDMGIGTDFMKLVSGNGVIDGDRKNQSRIQFEPYFQTIVDTNTMPKIEDSSIGWQERFVKVNLPYVFVAEPDTKRNPLEKQRDPDLYEKLTTPGELSGILNLVLYRAKEIAKTKTITKRSSAEMFAEYNEQSSSVSTFLDEFCEYVTDGTDFWTPSGPIYESYKTWCGYKVGEVVDRAYFGRQLKKFCGGFAPKRGKDDKRKSTTEYKRLIFDAKRCEEVLDILKQSMKQDVSSMSQDVSSMSQDVSSMSQVEKSHQISMSQVSQVNEWNKILKRFGDNSNLLYRKKSAKMLDLPETPETPTAGECVVGKIPETHTRHLETPPETEQTKAQEEHFKKVAEEHTHLTCAKCGSPLVRGQDGFREDTGPNGTAYYCTKNGCAYPPREVKP